MTRTCAGASPSCASRGNSSRRCSRRCWPTPACVRQAAQAAPAFEAAEVELARRIDAGQLPPLDPGLLTRVAAATVVGLLVLDVLGDPVVDARSCPAPDRIGLLAPVQTLSPIYATGGQPNGSGWLTNSATGGKAKQLDSGSGR